tara:strand:+ start:183 stop:656 length:474 start_codon:yes stop_codon:yes gene_type:complete
MSIVKSKHFKFICIIFIFLSFSNCQLKEPKNTHGMNFLKNKSSVLVINESNKNDVIKLIGSPHTISLSNENKWLYFERTLIKGKMHKLGQNVLKENNVLELTFNKYGVLVKKNIQDKEDMNKIRYSQYETQNTVVKESFVGRFLSSIRQKMYGKRKF